MATRAVFLFLAYFGLPVLIYGLALFVTWGGCWNPGEWSENIRSLVTAAWVVWAVVVSAFLAAP